jgi:hypothetical protein
MVPCCVGPTKKLYLKCFFSHGFISSQTHLLETSFYTLIVWKRNAVHSMRWQTGAEKDNEKSKDSLQNITMEDTQVEKAKKMPYFHRTLSPEDTALIGDITPKPLTDASPVVVVAETSNKLASGSAWNSAMTWEERDCTKWAKTKLPTLFTSAEQLQKTNQYQVTINKLENGEGSAQIAHVRGKARFIYELSFDLSFTVEDEKSGTSYMGKVNVSDVINDQLDDIDLAITWTGKCSPPGAEVATVRNTVLGKAMKSLIINKMKQFEEDFRQL